MTINVRQYEQRTLQHDWRGICQLNGIDFKSFWTGNEFNQLENLLAKGEIVFAFLAGNIQLTAKERYMAYCANEFPNNPSERFGHRQNS